MLPSSEKVHVQQSTVDSFLFYTCTMCAFVGGYMRVSTHALRGGGQKGVSDSLKLKLLHISAGNQLSYSENAGRALNLSVISAGPMIYSIER